MCRHCAAKGCLKTAILQSPNSNSACSSVLATPMHGYTNGSCKKKISRQAATLDRFLLIFYNGWKCRAMVGFTS